MSRFLIYFFILFQFCSFSQNTIQFTEEELNWIKENPVVYYGYDPFWKPIEFKDNGTHQGITRDYMVLLSERIGINFEPHPDIENWNNTIDLFESEKILFITAMGENEERLKKMNFTSTYLKYGYVIVSRKNGDFIGSLEDLSNKKIVLPIDYNITYKIENNEKHLNLEIIYRDNVNDCLMAVSTGEAEATCENLCVVSHYLNYSGFENLKIAAPTGYPDMESKIAVHKNHPILKDILDKGLASISLLESNQIINNWVSVQYEYGINMAKIWKITGICLGIIFIILSLILYWNRKLKREISLRKIAEQKIQESLEEISLQKQIIEEKSHEVLDSIKYAKRLQEAILPNLEDINLSFPKNFVLYLPKDIVAGDFYWLEKIHYESEKTKKVFLAVADCTGHGVPGAMVSVVCSNALNQSVLEHKMKTPGDILNKTTDLVIEKFEKGDNEVKDGMDISLISMTENEDENSTQIEFAGANNGIWIVSKRENIGIESNITQHHENGYYLHEVKPNKQPVGKFINRHPFDTKVLNLLKGERFYLFSDGYADQFGGMSGKKFKYKTFKELILSNTNQKISEQKELLEKTFNHWKQAFEQVDDVCVIGVEV